MNKELLLILKTLRKANGGILVHFCLRMDCESVECDYCPVNIVDYKYDSPAINNRYIKTIEVLIEQ